MGGKCSTSADANPCVDLFECKIPRDPASEDAAAVGVCPPALSRARTQRVPPNSVTHAERVVYPKSPSTHAQRTHVLRAFSSTTARLTSLFAPLLSTLQPTPQPAPPPAHTPQRFSFWNLANRHTQLPY